jgi:hypothetical protein
MSCYGELDAKACDALEAARLLPPGPKRSDAMKNAGRLRAFAEKRREQDESVGLRSPR